MRCPFCGSEDTQVKDSRRPTIAGDPPPPAVPELRRALHHLRARAAARADGGQEERAARALRSRQARALDPDLAAQAPGRGRAHRARHQFDRAPARKLGRERHPERHDRRAGDGSAGDARPGRLCALRLGLSQFPRGQGFRRIHRPHSAPTSTATTERHERRPRIMHAALDAGAARARQRCGPIRRSAACIVKDGEVVGRGWTQPGGRPHGETEALGRAGDAGRGATAYISLEPCAITARRRLAPMR